MREESPLATGISILGLDGVLLSRHLHGDSLRTVNHRLTSEQHMLHDGHCSRRLDKRFGIVVVIASAVVVAGEPSTGVEANAILSRIASEPCTKTLALYLIEAALHGVFLAADEVFGMLRQHLPHLCVALHISGGHHVG